MTATTTSSRPVVAAAAAWLGPHVVRTPVVRSPGIDRVAGVRVWLKAENLQHTGSYKFRGATRAVGRVAALAGERGVIAQSTGNHAVAVASAARPDLITRLIDLRSTGTHAVCDLWRAPDDPAVRSARRRGPYRR
jgi:threonine dehydratase